MRSPNGRRSRHDQNHSPARNPGRTRFPWASLSFSLEDCVASGPLTPGTAELLSRIIEAKLAFLIGGGTGSGKTTLLAALPAPVPQQELIVVVEDSRARAEPFTCRANRGLDPPTPS